MGKNNDSDVRVRHTFSTYFLFCIVLCVSHCTLRFILTSQHNRGDSKCIPMPSTILPVCSVIRDRESEQK